MNCKRIKKRLLIDYVEGNLEPDQNILVKDHLSICSQCQQHLEEIQSIRRLLRSYTVPDPGEAFWDGLLSRICSQANREKPAQKRHCVNLPDWIAWKKLTYTAAPILLILLFFPTYYLFQHHLPESTHQAYIPAGQEIENGFLSIEESVVQLPAKQLDKLLQKVAILILDTESLAASEFLTGIEWNINEEVSQMRKEKLDLLMKRLNVQFL